MFAIQLRVYARERVQYVHKSFPTPTLIGFKIASLKDDLNIFLHHDEE